MSTREDREVGKIGAGPSVESSRDSRAGAGWRCEEIGVPASGGRSFSWLNPVPVWLSRNQNLAPLLGDPTNDERRLWMKLQRQMGKLPEDLILTEHADREEVSFIVVGDTGEGDASQRAVVKPLLARGRDTDFMVICSDVIYPSGDAEDYDAKFPNMGDKEDDGSGPDMVPVTRREAVAADEGAAYKTRDVGAKK